MVDFKLAKKAAVIGILVNLILSVLVPMVFGSPKNKYLGEISGMFKHHNETRLTSSLIVAAAVFISVVAAQHLQEQ